MTVTTFPSRWGNYNVTRVTMAREPEVLRDADGTVTQAVITLEMTDMCETVSVTGATLFKSAAGRVRSVSYDGQQRTILKPKARDLYRSLLRQGYSPDRDWLNCDAV